MGDWSAEPWGTDEAADWFYQFWRNNSLDIVISEIKNFDPRLENYESVRAACHVITCFGSAYAWPDEYADERKEIMQQAINILSNMLNPPNDDWGFLDLCSHDTEIIGNVEQQITNLKKMLTQ